MPTVPAAPLRYSPAVEELEDGEAETGRALAEQMLKISDTTYNDGEGPLRGVHAKSHGILAATFTVLDNLPPALTQGLFARAATYEALVRFSTTPGDILPDKVSTPRGVALRVMDVDGPRLPGFEGDHGQDFLMVVGKAFNAPTGKAFLKNLKLLAGTTDKVEGLKIALSAALRVTESTIEALGGESATLKALGGYPETHILAESFFSQVPIRYGDYIAKVGIVPVSQPLLDLKDAKLDFAGDNDALRGGVRDFFKGSGGVWEFRVQLCTDLKDMPVEDATVPWPEDKSPYITVARLEAGPQDSWSDAQRQDVDLCTAFNPWKGLAAHQPLGRIMRLRKTVYPEASRARLQRAGCPMHR